MCHAFQCAGSASLPADGRTSKSIYSNYSSSRASQPIATPGQPTARQSAPPRTAYTPGVFLSYRRSDSAAETGRIYDRLVGHYGKEAIFKDVDLIPYGVDFRTYLYDMVCRCGALIAVIGPEWLSAINEFGLRRIDDPTDFVRIEIAAALGRRMPVVPLLVRGAVLPREIDLPIDLKPLVYQTRRRPETTRIFTQTWIGSSNRLNGHSGEE